MAIHPTAIISPKAELDPSVEVGPHAIIDDHVRIGPRTRIGPRAWITGWTDIGPDNVIHYGCVIGHEPQDIGYDGSETFLKIGAGNTFREYVTIHRGATKEDRTTRIGDRCYFMVGSHVGHNCLLGNGVLLVNGAMLAGHVTVEDRANISGACLIHQFVRIGTLVMMAGGTRVNKDVPPYCVTYHSNDVVGLNTIGLRRSGVTPERRTALREAFRTLYLAGLNIREALDKIRTMPQTPEITHFVEFIASSKRGICTWRGGRSGQQEDE